MRGLVTPVNAARIIKGGQMLNIRSLTKLRAVSCTARAAHHRQTLFSTPKEFSRYRLTNAAGSWSLSQSSAQGKRLFSSLPPYVELKMPALSPTMTQGNITTFKVKVGDKLSPGDLICDIESDKATIGWEAQEEGYVAAITVPDGAQEVKVGKTVLVLVEDKSMVPSFANYKGDSGSKAAEAPPASSPSPPSAASAQPAKPASDFPPHSVLQMPALSPTMTQGNIPSFKVKVGDKISAGDIICDIESDKATIGWEAQDDGYVAAILVKSPAQDVPVGKPVLVLVDDAALISKFESYTGEISTAPAAAPAAAKPAAASQPSPSGAKSATAAAPAAASARGGKIPASPLARRLAKETGISLSQVPGTGPYNRIIAADVVQALESGVASTAPTGAVGAAEASTPAGVPGVDFTEVKHTNVRKVIAQRLLQSKTTVPHYYLGMDMCLDNLLALRDKLNKEAPKSKEGKEAYKISVNDFIIKACAMALRQHPDVNAAWFDTHIRKYHYVDISVAVASPAGLITPIVADADRKGLVTISEEVKVLAGKAREGKLQPHEFQGGTFSVSNLGMFGISSFSAIINPPQACILAVGSSEQRVVAKPDGSFGVATYMRGTLSCDHRAVDGAVGAQFLQTLKSLIETPARMLL